MSIDSTAPKQSTEQQPQSRDLRGNLGTASLVLTVIAYNGPVIVLAGIVPLIIAFGNGIAAPLTFLTLGVLVAVFAVGINAMASRMTHAGAFYTYITAGLGRPPGLSAGGVAILAYLTLGAGVQILFGISIARLLESVFGVTNGPPWQLWAFAGWVTVSLLSLFNIDLSAKVIGAFSCTEILIALIWNARVYINGGPEGRSVHMFSNYFSGSLPYALVLAILCLTGFESLQVFRAESRDSQRTVPRATYISVALLTALYTVSSYAFIVAYGPSKALTAGATDPTGAFLNSVASYVATPVADIANILLTTSTFASALAVQSILARYLYSLGRDGVLPRKLGKPNEKHGSPMIAAAAAAAITGLLMVPAAMGLLNPDNAFTTMMSLGAFCLIILYFGACVAILVFFAKRKDIRISKWKSVVSPAVSTFGMGALLYLAVVHITDVLATSEIIAYVIVLAIAVLMVICWLVALWMRGHRPEVYERIGAQSETTD